MTTTLHTNSYTEIILSKMLKIFSMNFKHYLYKNTTSKCTYWFNIRKFKLINSKKFRKTHIQSSKTLAWNKQFIHPIRGLQLAPSSINILINFQLVSLANRIIRQRERFQHPWIGFNSILKLNLSLSRNVTRKVEQIRDFIWASLTRETRPPL